MKKWPLWLTSVLVVAIAAYAGLHWWQNQIGAADSIKNDRAILVDVTDMVPGIAVDARYYSSHNFTGERVDGYRANKVLVTYPTARALGKVERELNEEGLGLLIFDGYRPKRAVDHFVRWAAGPEDSATKVQYHPDHDKKELFELGYIAEMSGHSRGSTVDLTLIERSSGIPLDMGTPFDFFGSASAPLSKEVTADQRANRMRLREVMLKHGFKPLENEWWHFTLVDEPYPGTYFDFPVE